MSYMRLKRAMIRVGVTVAVATGVALLLVWLADIPDQYPDHGLAELTASEPPAVVASVACLIEEVRSEPGAFGVGSDFEILRKDAESTDLIVHGWVRRTSVSWVDSGIRVRTNPLSSGDVRPTTCEPWEAVDAG